MPLLLPNKAMLRSTKGWMSPVAFMTAAKPLCRNHNKADHRHHFDAFAEHIAGGGAVHHAQHHKHGKAQHRAQYQ